MASVESSTPSVILSLETRAATSLGRIPSKEKINARVEDGGSKSRPTSKELQAAVDVEAGGSTPTRSSGNRKSVAARIVAQVTNATMAKRASQVRDLGQGPSELATLAFKDLCYSVPAGGKARKSILQNFNGAVFPHEMLTLLGPSGSGKTSLLNLLNSRELASGAKLSGEILINGKPTTAAARRSLISFVARETAFLGDFTVTETLWVAGRFYFGFGQDKRLHDKVEGLIDAVGLRSAAHTMVGSIFRKGLSGGQKRRLSLAIELISSPSVVLVDEPTSGLDSSSAYAMLMELRNIAAMGHTLIVTLNQPTSHVWSCLDLVTIVSEGRQVYFGDADECVDYFDQLLSRDCPNNTNPADYVISLLMPSDASIAKRGKRSIQDLADAFAKSAVHVTMVTQRFKDCTMAKKNTVYPSKARKSIKGPLAAQTPVAPEPKDERVLAGSKSAGFMASLTTLTKRNAKSVLRNPGVLLVRLTIYLALALAVGLIYLFQAKTFDAAHVRATVSVLLASVAFFVFLSVAAIPFIMEERQVFKRESGNGAYFALEYVLARVSIAVFTTFLSSLVSAIVLVYMVGLRDLMLTVMPMWSALLVAEVIVLIVGATAKHFMSGIATGAALYGVFIITGGFLIRFNSMTWILRWVGYTDFLWYSFQDLMIMQWDGVTLNSTLYPTGAAVLQAYYIDVNVPGYWGNIGILWGMSAALTIVLWLVMRGSH